MQEHFDHRKIVDRTSLKDYRRKEDTQSLKRLVIHLSLFFGCFALLATVVLPSIMLIPTLLFFGFLVFSLYAPFHETTHETAFKSKKANLAVAWITGIIYGYSPGVHRAFHFQHHRLTNRAGDPEKGFSLPDMPFRLFFQLTLAGLLGMLVPVHSMILSFAPVDRWESFEAGWAPRRERTRLAWESRIVSAFWVVFILLLIPRPELALYIAFGIFLGRFIHAFVTYSEHEELPEEGTMMQRTRTVLTNPVFRWFWWNMNYHSEHHMWPIVPWYRLPDIHQEARAHVICETGYTRFFAQRMRPDTKQSQSQPSV